MKKTAYIPMEWGWSNNVRSCHWCYWFHMDIDCIVILRYANCK